MNRRYFGVLLVVPLLLSLTAVPAVHAQGAIYGNWVITQAAQQSQGSSSKVIACGTFSLVVLSSQGLPTRGVYAGTISFSTSYADPSAHQPLLLRGPVQGTWMIQSLGAVFVNFKGSDPVPGFGSIVSPAPQPHPSIDPTPFGCAALGNGFLGLLHLPGQGTEGVTLYSDTPVDPSIFTS
jgi:hypothetical protein